MAKSPLQKISNLMKDGAFRELILKRGGMTFATKIAGQAVAFLLYLFLARYLGDRDFGYYMLAWTWVQLMLIPGKAGLDTAATKFLPTYAAREDWASYKGFLHWGAWGVILKSVVTALIGFAAVWWIGSFSDADLPVGAFWLIFALLPALSFMIFYQTALRAAGKAFAGQFAEAFLRPFIQLCLVLGVIIFAVRPSPFVGAICLTAALFFALVWLLWQGKKKFKSVIPQDVTSKAVHFKEWYAYAFFMILISGSALLMRQTDVAMLGWLSSPEETGRYAAATRIANLGVFVLTAINMVVAPVIAGLFEKKDFKELQRTLIFSAQAIFVGTLVFSAALWILAVFVLGLFGDEFKDAEITLKILLAGQVFSALAGPVGYIMTLTGHQKQTAIIFTVTVLLNMVLNYILIGTMHGEGAAIATVISTIVWNFVMLVFVLRALKLNPTVLPFKLDHPHGA